VRLSMKSAVTVWKLMNQERWRTTTRGWQCGPVARFRPRRATLLRLTILSGSPEREPRELVACERGRRECPELGPRMRGALPRQQTCPRAREAKAHVKELTDGAAGQGGENADNRQRIAAAIKEARAGHCPWDARATRQSAPSTANGLSYGLRATSSCIRAATSTPEIKVSSPMASMVQAKPTTALSRPAVSAPMA
jgi:hypothetical protein